jgi:hypothetical protein
MGTAGPGRQPRWPCSDDHPWTGPRRLLPAVYGCQQSLAPRPLTLFREGHGKANAHGSRQCRRERRQYHHEVDCPRRHASPGKHFKSTTRAIGQQRHSSVLRVPLLVLVVLWAAQGVPTTARAQAPLGYAVHAQVDPDRGVVEGAMHVAVEVPPGEEHVRLWLYADRLAAAPSALDEINAEWIFPGELSLGGIEVRDVRVAGEPVQVRRRSAPAGTARGRDVAGSDLLVPVPVGAAQVEIRLRFVLRLPHRFGRLGRVGSRLTFAAPWYPVVVGADDAYDFRVPHRVRVDILGTDEGLLGSRRFRGRAEVRGWGPYVPLLVAPRLYETRRRVNGRTLRHVATRRPYEPPGPDAEGIHRLQDVVRVDTVGHLSRELSRVFRTLRAADVPVTVPDVTTIVEVPSRTELASTAPGWTLVSDRVYEIFPARGVRSFHDRAVRHALFRGVMERAALPEGPAARPLGADLRAALLNDVDAVRRDEEERTPRDLVGWAGFHPAVDQLLYAPQVPFEQVYFGGRGDGDRFRDDPFLARRPRSTGGRVLEMARDALDEEPMADWARALVALQGDLGTALAEVAPERIDRLPVWVAAAGLPVNYRLGPITSEPTEEGYRHRIEIFRDGADRPEPVEVAVDDRKGYRVIVRWDAAGPKGVVTATTPAPLSNVTIDPRGRLVQSAEIAQDHPRYDDAKRHPWRPPIFQGLSLSAGVSEQVVVGFVDFVMRRRYDLRHGVGVRLNTNVRSSGGALRYIHGFGPLRHTNARAGFLSVGGEVDRFHPGFTVDGEGGWRSGARVSLGYDTRVFAPDPRSGGYVVGSARVGAVRKDDGQVVPTWTLGVRTNATIPLGLRNVLVFVGGASYTGGEALPGERPGLGGQGVLRGYQTDELLGRGVVFGVLEHRWTMLSDLALNALHLAWVREVQLAVFTGAGASFRTVTGERILPGAEAGGGLRFHFEYGGIQPGVLSVDVSAPLVREAQEAARRPPVSFWISFDQYF